MGKKYLARRLASFKALMDGEGSADGTFEAIVSVFGNVDRVGEMVMPGAFKDSLAEWAERDRPIPVIFAHQWDNLDAHIGHVLEAEERDVGLYVHGALNIEEPFAAKVFRKLVDGTIAEFSFAYEEIEEGWADDVHELRKLDVLEVGPCLVGANPATQLLGVKDLGQKPYPNEHACRLRDPGDFEDNTFRRSERESDGKRYSVILGRLTGEETMTEQAYRYGIDVWEEAAARSHCGEHDGSFEAASGEKAWDGLAGKAGAQAIHDLAVNLGAKCGELDESGDGDGDGDQGGGGKATPRGPSPETLAARIGLELMAQGTQLEEG